MVIFMNFNVDGMNVRKIFANFLIFGDKIEPTMIVEDIKELDSDYLDVLKESGIKGLIVDVDETLREMFHKVPEENIEWLSLAKSKMKVAVVSNGYNTQIREILEQLDIPYFDFAFKPLKININKALDSMDITGEESLFIGNSQLTDMLGGYRVGSKLCKVKKNKQSNR